ncbi:SunI/YnzG family protein [Paenibacillus sp. Z6-24]
MSGIRVARDEEQLVIDWQRSKIEIPLGEAVHVAVDQDVFSSDDHPALLKCPYGTRKRIVIQTSPDTYLILNDKYISVMNKSQFGSHSLKTPV